MKIIFSNVVVSHSGCVCCGDGDGKIICSDGPFVIETSNENVSVEDHAKIAFGEVISYDAVVEV